MLKNTPTQKQKVICWNKKYVRNHDQIICI